jgi:pyridoxamine 5'-phosphate oxidase family protein
MSAFTDGELAYLLTEFEHLVTERRLGRLATVGKDGTPHVVPVGWSYNAEHDTIDVPGFELEQTKKFRDVERSGRAAIVVDDLASFDPWRPRGVEVRGRAETVHEGRPLIRIHPDRVVAWGIDGDDTPHEET